MAPRARRAAVEYSPQNEPLCCVWLTRCKYNVQMRADHKQYMTGLM